LYEVKCEIDKLQKQLALKEAEAAELSSAVATHDANIAKIEDKFKGDINLLNARETAVKEKEEKIEQNKMILEQIKAKHAKEFQDISNAFLNHERLVSTVESEIDVTLKLKDFISKEINGNSELFTQFTGKKEPKDVLLSQASIDNAREALEAAKARMLTLKDEVKEINQRLPGLEEEKIAAVARRDFKSAAKFSKEQKGLTARMERYKEEIAGAALKDISDSEEMLEKAISEMRELKEKSDKNEKNIAMEYLTKHGKKIDRFKSIMKELSRENANGEVRITNVVGDVVLGGAVSVLTKEGEIFASRFRLEFPFDLNEKKDYDISKKNNSAELRGFYVRANDTDEASVISGVTMVTTPSCDDENLRALKKSLNETEKLLKEAVANEDYEKAADLDELLRELEIKAQLHVET